MYNVEYNNGNFHDLYKDMGNFFDTATGGIWSQTPHLKYLQGVFAELYSGKYDKVMVLMPPRSGKSLAVGLFEAFYAKHNANHRILHTNYETGYARSEIDHAVRFIEDLRAKKEGKVYRSIELTNGVSLVGIGVGGALTGQSFNLGVINDPIKNSEEARGKVRRDSLYDWYSTVFLTRFPKTQKLIYIGSRWHSKDLAARIQFDDRTRNEWKVITIRQICDEPTSWDALERRFGESLKPVSFNNGPEDYNPDIYFKEVMRTAENLGEYYYQMMYQQRAIAYYEPEDL